MTKWKQLISSVPGVDSAIDAVLSKTSVSYHHQKYHNRFEQYQEKEQAYLAQVATVQTDLDNLVAIRVQAQEVLKQAVAFLGNASLKERNLNPDFAIHPIELERLNLTNVFDIFESAGTLLSSGKIGLGASALTTELIGRFANASTGTPIRNLSGAARQRAIMAKLGGGTKAMGGGGVSGGKLVYGGIVISVFAGSVLISQVIKTTEAKTETHKAMAEIDIHEEKIESTIIYLNGLSLRADELRNTTISIQTELEQCLLDADPNDDQAAYHIFKTTKKLAELLEMPVNINPNQENGVDNDQEE